jgi:hypothetical protein
VHGARIKKKATAFLLPLKLIPYPNTARRGYVLSSFFLQVFLLSVCKLEAFHILAITWARVGTVK